MEDAKDQRSDATSMGDEKDQRSDATVMGRGKSQGSDASKNGSKTTKKPSFRRKDPRPEGCTFPDCFSCPHPDCVFDEDILMPEEYVGEYELDKIIADEIKHEGESPYLLKQKRLKAKAHRRRSYLRNREKELKANAERKRKAFEENPERVIRLRREWWIRYHATHREELCAMWREKERRKRERLKAEKLAAELAALAEGQEAPESGTKSAAKTTPAKKSKLTAKAPTNPGQTFRRRRTRNREIEGQLSLADFISLEIPFD